MKLHLYSSEVGLNPERMLLLTVDCGAEILRPQVAFCWDDVATGKKLEGMALPKKVLQVFSRASARAVSVGSWWRARVLSSQIQY